MSSQIMIMCEAEAEAEFSLVRWLIKKYSSFLAEESDEQNIHRRSQSMTSLTARLDNGSFAR
jgi:hypothetical protein